MVFNEDLFIQRAAKLQKITKLGCFFANHAQMVEVIILRRDVVEQGGVGQDNHFEKGIILYLNG